MLEPSIPTQRRYFEILAVALTGIGKLVLVDLLQQKLVFILLAGVFWIGYVAWRARQEPGILRYWGFRTDNFSASFRQLLPFAVLATAGFLVYGWYSGTLLWSWHLVPILLIYPLWGTVQQFLVVGLIAGNLADQTDRQIGRPAIVAITAVLFAIVHYPSWALIAGTFLLAIVYTLVYLRERNLYVLGLFHGWLGAFYYYFALGRDPFLEVFAILLR